MGFSSSNIVGVFSKDIMGDSQRKLHGGSKAEITAFALLNSNEQIRFCGNKISLYTRTDEGVEAEIIVEHFQNIF